VRGCYQKRESRFKRDGVHAPPGPVWNVDQSDSGTLSHDKCECVLDWISITSQMSILSILDKGKLFLNLQMDKKLKYPLNYKLSIKIVYSLILSILISTLMLYYLKLNCIKNL